ncbi:MAG TPA: GNAT family N-acetyltransferase [Chthonomonadaceae bacterium]|jgi:ribosomal protein S18 acetylase RimI-like enzyme|nr:GNAT family N-acetyltransferase [Chthonomonadaceae bacterium]
MEVPAPVLAAALEANGIAWWQQFVAAVPQAEWHESADILYFATGVTFPWLNGVLRARLMESCLDAAIAETIGYFRARHLPMVWHVGPSTQPASLGRELQAYGLYPSRAMPGMAIDLLALPEDSPAPPELTIQEARDAGALAAWQSVFTAVFRTSEAAQPVIAEAFARMRDTHPAQRYFCGYWQGKPVACSSLFCGAGVAGLYNVGVLPEARGQGFGTALTLAPLRAACADGYRVGALSSTESGYGLYRRLGFQECATFESYLLEDAEA